MNQWLDDHPEKAHIRAPEQMLDGRVNDYHRITDPSDERYMGDGPAPRITGSHGRADVDVGTGDWSDEYVTLHTYCLATHFLIPT